MTDNTIQVKIEVKDANLRKDLQDIVRSVGGFGVQKDGDGHWSDIFIFELDDNPEKGFKVVQSLLDLDAIGEVFFASRHSDPAVLLQAIRTGAKEFFSQPIKEQEVRHALQRFKERHEKSKNKGGIKIGQIIYLIGSKGGVGTTTVAVNLAVNLAKMNGAQSVALIDMNKLFGDVPLFLEMKPKFDWGEITRNISRLDTTFLMNVLSKHASGIYVLPSPTSASAYNVATPQIIGHLLGLMQRMFDFVVIDGGQSLDETSLKILGVADIVLLVSILSLPCLSSSKKLLNAFHLLGYPSNERTMVVINRYLQKSQISLKDAQNSIGKEIFWTLPNDYPTTLSAICQGKPLSELAPKAAVTKRVRELTGALLKGEEKTEKRRWKFFRRG